MPRKRQRTRHRGAYFVWLLGQRNGYWQADGRSNTPDVGRHSLGTKDRDEAVRRVDQLDLDVAVKFGRADPSVLRRDTGSLVPLDEGRRRYLAHVANPPVLGGAAPRTVARYRAVFDKFARFAEENRIRFWSQVTNGVLEQYGRWLDGKDYAGRSQYLELTTVKQCVKWLVREGLLPPSCLLTVRLSKDRGTTTYCYSLEEVRAIVAWCRGRGELRWLGDVVVALATTGLRIGEVADLRWSNVDLEGKTLHLRDTTRQARRTARADAQTTKSHRGRVLTVHPDLLEVLRRMPRAPDQRVFHGPRGGRLKADTVRRVLQRDVLAALSDRFPGADGRPGIAAGRVHSFRHYYASTAADAGVSEQMLMSWLGHTESRMIQHYYHLRQDEARRQIRKIPSVETGSNSDGAAAGPPPDGSE